jgi:hypothetical protein
MQQSLAIDAARAAFLASVAGRCFDGSVTHTWTDGNSPGVLGWRVCPGRQVRQTLFSGTAVDIDAGSKPGGWAAPATESFSGGSDASCPQDGRRRSSRVTYACTNEGPALTRSFETPVCYYEITLALSEWCAVEEAARGGVGASAWRGGADEPALTAAAVPVLTPPAPLPHTDAPASNVPLFAPLAHEPVQEPPAALAHTSRVPVQQIPVHEQTVSEPVSAAAATPEMHRATPVTSEAPAPLHSPQLASVQLRALRHESRGEADVAASAAYLGPVPRSTGALGVALTIATAASAAAVFALGFVKRHGLSGVR